MKKFKILAPLTCGLVATSMVAPILSSCGCSKQEQYHKVIPSDLLDIDGNTLKGFKEDVDISKYDTLEIPNGVRIVDEYAFGESNANYQYIKRLVISSSVKEIRSNAFTGLNSLLEIDLSQLDTYNAHYIEIGRTIFGSYNDNRYVTLKLSDNLTNVSRNYLIKKLIAAGVPACWFTAPTTGHLNFDGNKETEVDNVKPVEYSAKLNGISSVNQKVSIILQKTGGAENTDVYLQSSSLSNKNDAGDLDITFEAVLDAKSGYTLKNGDDVIYRAIFICKDPVDTLWVQTIDNLKLKYVGDGNIQPTSISLDIADKTAAVDEQFTLIPTITPIACTDKTIKWSSSDKSIATVDDNGNVTTKSSGEVTITATTVNGLTASAKIDVQADIWMYWMYYMPDSDSYCAYLSMNVNPDEAAKVKILTVPKSYNDGKNGKKPVTNVYSTYTTTESEYGPEWSSITNPYVNVEKIIIPNTLEYIDYGTFGNVPCSEVVFAENSKLSCIENYAFWGCKNLSKIDLPKSVVSICPYSLDWNYMGYKYNDDATIWYLKSGDNEYAIACGLNRYVNDPLALNSNVELISSNFCQYWGQEPAGWSWQPLDISSIKNLTNLRGIGDDAFKDEVHYSSAANENVVEMPLNLKYIGCGAFRNCYFNELKLNKNLEVIDNGAFARSDILSITIPKSVKQIGQKEYEYFEHEERAISYTLNYTPESNEFGVFESAEIYDFEFEDTTSASNLEIIGQDAFSNCVITSIWENNEFVIPSSVKELCPGSLALKLNSFYLQNTSNAEIQPIKFIIPTSVEKMQTIFTGYYWQALNMGKLDRFNILGWIHFPTTINTDYVDLEFGDNKTWDLYCQYWDWDSTLDVYIGEQVEVKYGYNTLLNPTQNILYLTNLDFDDILGNDEFIHSKSKINDGEIEPTWDILIEDEEEDEEEAYFKYNIIWEKNK